MKIRSIRQRVKDVLILFGVSVSEYKVICGYTTISCRDIFHIFFGISIVMYNASFKFNVTSFSFVF